MPLLLDTSVAILLRDGDDGIIDRLASESSARMISVLTRVELEGGVYRNKEDADVLRPRVDLLLQQVTELPFTAVEAALYGRIVQSVGFSRAKIIDRMVASTALAAGVPLATLNPRDFRDVPDLQLQDWS